jgi:Mce-associated membrane protein
MTEESASKQDEARAAQRRRASRPAGPAGQPVISSDSGPVRAEATPVVSVRLARPVGPPRRRRPHRVLVAAVGLSTVFVLVAALATFVVMTMDRNRDDEALLARNQRFVDTASQNVVNMFSYTQENIDESVNRFVEGTSGPLRSMMTQGNNAENLKLLFRDTQATSEAVINGAALEKLDETAGNAAVLVSVRVTVTDIDGTNAPSQPYRLRVIIHEDDNGNMTAYDLKYPDGGN